MRNITLALVGSMLMACSSTYHPEYHPVTATTITQTYSGGGIVAAPQRQVVVAPAPATPPVIIEAPPAANPDEFFQTSYR